MVTKTDEIFLKAAEAAEAEIPQKEKRLNQLRLEMEAISAELSQLRMIAAYGKNKIAQTKPDLETLYELAMASSKSDVTPGMQLVAGLLAKLAPLTAREIKKNLDDQGSVYGLSTIYSYLSKGAAAGIFAQDKNDQWTLKKRPS